MRVELEEEEEVEMRGGKEWDWVVDEERTEKKRTEKKGAPQSCEGGKEGERLDTDSMYTRALVRYRILGTKKERVELIS